ncbi:MAG: hypothetical protein Kow0032_17890 [Methyloligellaceae bacterium]
MPHYFAYGSNMHPRVMSARCPGARPVGRAALSGWRFHVTTRGSAAILPSPGDQVHGVLWRCSPAHLASLDLYEGVSWGNYWRRRLLVADADGRTTPAFVYINARHYPGRARVTYMMTAILPAANLFELPPDYVESLRGWLPEPPLGEKRQRYRGSRKPLRFPRR